MTVASEIERIKTNIANAYTQAGEKGATLPTVQNSENLATTVASITGGSQTRAGLSLDNFIGQIDEDGTLLAPNVANIDIVFEGVKDLDAYALHYKFAYLLANSPKSFTAPDLVEIKGSNSTNCFLNASNLENVNFPVLESITGNLPGFCQGCSNLTSFNFPALKTLNGTQAFYSVFQGCTSLKSGIFPQLTTISGSNAFSRVFSGCTALESIEFPELSAIGGGNPTNYTFANCTALTTISFPKLGITSVPTITSTTFSGCTNLTEIHFSAEAQANIEAAAGYSTQWGATNANIYFDL